VARRVLATVMEEDGEAPCFGVPDLFFRWRRSRIKSGTLPPDTPAARRRPGAAFVTAVDERAGRSRALPSRTCSGASSSGGGGPGSCPGRCRLTPPPRVVGRGRRLSAAVEEEGGKTSCLAVPDLLRDLFFLRRRSRIKSRMVPPDAAAARRRPGAAFVSGGGGGGREDLVPCRPGPAPGPLLPAVEVPDRVRDAAA
jgi:hypothetical protein